MTGVADPPGTSTIHEWVRVGAAAMLGLEVLAVLVIAGSVTLVRAMDWDQVRCTETRDVCPEIKVRDVTTPSVVAFGASLVVGTAAVRVISDGPRSARWRAVSWASVALVATAHLAVAAWIILRVPVPGDPDLARWWDVAITGVAILVLAGSIFAWRQRPRDARTDE